MAKEAKPPAQFLGQMTVPVGRFGVSMNLIDSPNALKSLKIRFESSTMALTNLTTFGVAVGATVFAVKVEVEYRY